MTPGTKSLGRLVLDSQALLATDHDIVAKFTCESEVPCTFKYSISTTAEIGRTGQYGPALVTDATNPLITVPAGKTIVLSESATQTVLALLVTHHGQILAKLTSRPRTGQKGVISYVSITSSALAGRPVSGGQHRRPGHRL